MTECLPDEREIHVSSYQMARERMLQTVRVPFLWRQTGDLGRGSEYTEELGSIQPTALLRGEDEVAAVMTALFQPNTKGYQLVQQGLSPVRVERLHGLE